MRKSRSTPMWKGGYWKSKKPESEASLDTQEAEDRGSFEELIIPNRTRLPSWNKAPKPSADDYQIALNLLRLQSSRSSLAPSSTSHPPKPLSRKFSKLRNSASSPTPLNLHRCSNPSIKIYPLSEVTQDCLQVRGGREASETQIETETEIPAEHNLLDKPSLQCSSIDHHSPMATNTYATPKATSSWHISESQPQPIRIELNKAFSLQHNYEHEGNELAHTRIQDSDQFDAKRRLGQGPTSTEILNNDIEPILEPQQTESTLISPDDQSNPSLVEKDSRATSSHGSIDSIRPISEHTQGIPSVTTLDNRSSPVEVAPAPATQFQITSIADFNSVLGTDAFRFPFIYGPTTLRLASCLVPLLNEIVYG
ncbi:MAG: hypothetical protein Q9160_003477, partial [Pyrenula sp. 1 TL-2023]